METKVRQGEATEDQVTGAIEAQTARVPSSAFLAMAIGSMAASLLFKIMRKDNMAVFVGMWAPSFLIMGNYNKMVKQHGSDGLQRVA